MVAHSRGEQHEPVEIERHARFAVERAGRLDRRDDGPVEPHVDGGPVRQSSAAQHVDGERERGDHALEHLR